MRVGIVIHRFDPSRGGAEQWTWDFTRWLNGQGCEVHVIAAHFPRRTDLSHVVPHRVAAKSLRDFPHAASALAGSLGLDIVHDMGHGIAADIFQPHAGCPQAVQKRKLLACTPWMRHVARSADWLTPRRRRQFALARRQVVHPDGLFVMVSQKVADDYGQWFELPAERQRVIYNGVDLDYFRPRPEQRRRSRHELQVADQDFLLVFVGNNFRLKGLSMLLNSVAKMRQSGMRARLCVVGSGRVSTWKRKAARLGVAQHVAFTGSVQDVRPYYAAADAFVLPTISDSCSLSVLEAMACELPVITTRDNGVSALLRNGWDSVILESSLDSNRLVDAVWELHDEGRRAAMVRAARATIRGRSLLANFEEVFAVYLEVLQRREGRWPIQHSIQRSRKLILRYHVMSDRRAA